MAAGRSPTGESGPDGMAIPIDSWDSAENARRYAEFTRTYGTYQQTSRDVVGLACPAPDATVVDLACGTGITTEMLLSALGDHGRVIAVDASEAMLAAAQSVIHDERVRWLHLPAERLAEGHVAGVDAVVCNSAIWQTDVRATAAAVRRVLHPGGRFVFNLGAPMLADHRRAGLDPLMDAMKVIAARDYGWVPAEPGPADPGRGELSETWLRQVLHEAGFRVDQIQGFSYLASLEEQGAWLSIPVFTTRLFGRLPYEQRMAVLRQAYQHLAADHADPVTVEWVAFAATACCWR
jgi:ubiquinone/menaquinone biosynthesis C-methylase UbiE